MIVTTLYIMLYYVISCYIILCSITALIHGLNWHLYCCRAIVSYIMVQCYIVVV